MLYNTINNFFLYLNFILFLILTDYDPANVPIVYPDNNMEPDSNYNEIEREREQKRIQELEAKQREEQNKLNQKILEEQERQRQEELERERQREQNRLSTTPRDDEDNTIIPPSTTSTTARPTPKKPNKLEPRCKLPIEPQIDVDFNAGYRFGTSGNSRVEYSRIPVKIRKTYDIALQFKTSEPNGVLFYAADSRHTDFVALYLQNGYVSFQLNVFIYIYLIIL